MSTSEPESAGLTNPAAPPPGGAAGPGLSEGPAEGAGRPGRLEFLLVGPYRLLRGNRPLGLLTLSHAAAMLGIWMSIVSITVLVYIITQSAATVALITLVRLVPSGAFSLAMGSLIDRWDRTRLMVGATAGCAVCMVGLATVHSRATLPLAFALMFLSAALASLIRPTINTVLTTMVPAEEYEQANSLIGQMDSLADIVGPLFSSLLLLAGALQASFVFAAAAFAVAGIAFVLVHTPRQSPSTRPEDESAVGQIVAGFRFLFRENERVLAALTLSVDSLAMLNGGWWSLIVLLSARSFHLGGQGTGFLEAVYSIGGLIGGFLIGFSSGRLRLGGLLMIGLALSSLATALFGVSPAGILPFVSIGILGITEIFVQINAATVLQAATPHDLLGRAFSAFDATKVVAELVGALIVGPLIAILGAPGATVAFAAFSLVTLAAALPLLLKLEAALGVRIFLRQVPIFAGLSRRTLDALGDCVQLEQALPGTTIVREGDQGDRLYMVKRGDVDVLAKGSRPRAMTVAVLSKLDYFGEIALLRDMPHTVTIQSRGAVELYSLGRDDFQELLRRSTELQEVVTRVGNARYADTQSKLLLRLHE